MIRLRRGFRRRSDTMDMFANYEKLIVSLENRRKRAVENLDNVTAELEAARHALAQMRASTPPATPARGSK